MIHGMICQVLHAKPSELVARILENTCDQLKALFGPCSLADFVWQLFLNSLKAYSWIIWCPSKLTVSCEVSTGFCKSFPAGSCSSSSLLSFQTAWPPRKPVALQWPFSSDGFVSPCFTCRSISTKSYGPDEPLTSHFHPLKIPLNPCIFSCTKKVPHIPYVVYSRLLLKLFSPQPDPDRIFGRPHVFTTTFPTCAENYRCLFYIYPLVNKHSLWKWPSTVDLPIKNGDFP